MTVAVGLSMGLGAITWLRRPRVLPVADGSLGARPVSPVPPPPARLQPKDLVELLGTLRGQPAAERFAADFLASPALRAVWDDYRSDGDLHRAVFRLRASLEFRALMDRSSKEPGFEASVSAVLGDPRLAAALEDAEARLSPAQKTTTAIPGDAEARLSTSPYRPISP